MMLVWELLNLIPVSYPRTRPGHSIQGDCPQNISAIPEWVREGRPSIMVNTIENINSGLTNILISQNSSVDDSIITEPV